MERGGGRLIIGAWEVKMGPLIEADGFFGFLAVLV